MKGLLAHPTLTTLTNQIQIFVFFQTLYMRNYLLMKFYCTFFQVRWTRCPYSIVQIKLQFFKHSFHAIITFLSQQTNQGTIKAKSRIWCKIYEFENKLHKSLYKDIYPWKNVCSRVYEYVHVYVCIYISNTLPAISPKLARSYQ